jgi:hypothetical protein
MPGRLGPFSWRWPEGTECFDRGWAAVAVVDGQEVRARHGIGRRDTYGRSRVHSVTWVDGEPLVEGVGADDYDSSGCLLSLIKVTKHHLKRQIRPAWGRNSTCLADRRCARGPDLRLTESGGGDTNHGPFGKLNFQWLRAGSGATD